MEKRLKCPIVSRQNYLRQQEGQKRLAAERGAETTEGLTLNKGVVAMRPRVSIAHVRESDGAIQSVAEHLRETADLCSRFASKLGLPAVGRALGLSHDFAKYSTAFQTYIRAASGMLGPEKQAHARKSLKGTIDHSTAGSVMLASALTKTPHAAQMLSNVVAAHHNHDCLLDCLSADGSTPLTTRLQKPRDTTHADDAQRNADPDIMETLTNLLALSGLRDEFLLLCRRICLGETHENLRQFHLGLLARYLYSCLVDADRLSTADFEKPKAATFRSAGLPDWPGFVRKLDEHLAGMTVKNNVDTIRAKVSIACRDAGVRDTGLYALTVPTGGGKTLASLRFALHHAAHHSAPDAVAPIERIIYVIPYTSIIDQNAATVRSILGEKNVLEHHSNLVPDRDNWRNRVLAEDWDAPIVFTTSVQFLDAVFAASTGAARRMHQLARAVIIFDEIQTLPVRTVHMFNNVANFLTAYCGSTVVLCTATQPLLHRVDPAKGCVKLSADHELVPDVTKLFEELRRTTVTDKRKPGGWHMAETAAFVSDRIADSKSVLVVANTKASALSLYNQLKATISETPIFHLSTNMCPAHRKVVLDDIRKQLDKYAAVVCVSTQLIEAGVDVDFGCAIRYLAGLDSIAQTGGRCNRNGRRTESPAPVYVLNPAEEDVSRLTDIRAGQDAAERVLGEFARDPHAMTNDLLSPTAIARFYLYYFHNRAGEMDYPIKANDKRGCGVDTNLLDLLAANATSIPSFTRRHRVAPPFPMRQAFATAARAFAVIDAPTRGIVVPYGEAGQSIVAELASAFTSKDVTLPMQVALLRRAQQYTVNVFPNVLDRLLKQRAIYEAQEDSGIYYLDPRYYHPDTGITVEPSAPLPFCHT